MTDAERLTAEQADEVAYRFIWQYTQREPNPDGVALQEMLVALEPVGDQARINDPACWPDGPTCVADTLDGAAVGRFPAGVINALSCREPRIDRLSTGNRQ